MDRRQRTEISKYLSFVLRHRPESIGLMLSDAGWASVEDLLAAAARDGRPFTLEQLREIAPVVAVRGNMDRGGWAAALPETEVVEVDVLLLYILHNLSDLDLDPATGAFHAVISGHSHRPGVEERDGVLFLNPGSAGPRRFTLPVAVARLRIRAGRLEAQIVELRERLDPAPGDSQG